MTNDQISNNSIISIEVLDNTSLNFLFDTQTGEPIINTNASASCKITLNELSFERLKQGQSTFEQEVQYGHLKIEGDHKVLRAFGRSIRE